MSVYLLATLDTKGSEAQFVRERLNACGVATILMDTGCMGQPRAKADISREAVFAAAGTTLAKVQAEGNRGQAVELAAAGAAQLVSDAYAQGNVQGVLALGGSAGTTIGTAAMRALPLGVAKLMVSTLASGQVRPYVGDKDICMLNSVVDILGLNRLSRPVLTNAAHAMAGMVQHAQPELVAADKPLVAATMFGVTTPCVDQAKAVLEQAGFEVVVLHATGSGGRTMEALIADGLICGVLDLTTTELADELVGGVLSAGPQRLTAAAQHGVPQVVSVGATDMVNFGPRESVPEKFAGRNFHIHNPTVTLMRTTPEENTQLGEEIGRKVAGSTGPAIILLPRLGVSAIDQAGQSFDDPPAREALFAGIRRTAGPVEVSEIDAHINDTLFAETAARRLIELMQVAAK